MGPLPRSNGGNIYLLVVIDHFTKWVKLFAMNKITDSRPNTNDTVAFVTFQINGEHLLAIDRGQIRNQKLGG